MAVTTTTTEDGPFTANGVTVAFPFTFKAASETGVKVVSVVDDVEAIIDEADYAVTLEDSAGGTVLFAVAPGSSLGDLYVRSDPDFTEDMDLDAESDIRQAILDAFDRAAVRDIALLTRLEALEATVAGLETLLALVTAVEVSDLTDTVTIASGAITVPSSVVPMLVSVDTEGAAAADDLVTINGGQAGQIITLRPVSGTRVTTVKDGTGNIQLSGGDFVLNSGNDMLMLQKSGTSWRAISTGGNNN